MCLVSEPAVIFFFSSRRRHTRYWRDWSSDVLLFRSQQVGLVLIHQVLDPVEPFALPPIRSDVRASNTTPSRCLRSALGVVVIEIGVGGVVPVIRHAREGPRLVAAMRRGIPDETAREVFADSKAQPLLLRRRADGAHHVPLDAARRGVPARLVVGLPHVEVIVMHSHADEILGPGLLVQRHQRIRIELVAFPDPPADVLVPEFRGVAVILEMILVSRIAFDVHALGVPVAELGGRFRSPVRPDPELGVAVPIRHLVILERFPGAAKRPRGNLRAFRLSGSRAPHDNGGSDARHYSQHTSPADAHSLPFHVAALSGVALTGRQRQSSQKVNRSEPCITRGARVETTSPNSVFTCGPFGWNRAAVLTLANWVWLNVLYASQRSEK